MILTIGAAAALCSCSQGEKKTQDTDFHYLLDEFADLKVIRFRVPGWDNLSLRQKEYAYHLSEAAKLGRDITWDQYCKWNLPIRHVVEDILNEYEGDRECADFQNFTVYAKRLFFANGIHHHYSEDKFFPECPKEYFQSLMEAVGDGEQATELLEVIYSPDIYPQRRSTSKTGDIVELSAVNFYDGVTREEVDKYYNSMMDPNDKTPISYGLNTKVVKEDGKVVEKPWKVGGIFGPALEKICAELEKAAAVAETDLQKEAIGKLVEYYRTGDLKTWDDFNIDWVQDTVGTIDFINGFIEDYDDPLGRKATWEGYVNMKDSAASARTEVLSANAQWFEDNSPVDPRFRKPHVKGVSPRLWTASPSPEPPILPLRSESTFRTPTGSDVTTARNP